MESKEQQLQPIAAAAAAPASPETETIFRSKLPDIAITNTLPLHRYCFERLPEVAARPCLIDGATGAVLTYAEVDRLSRRLAAALRCSPLGLGRGAVVMNLLRNSAEFVLSFFAASRVGAAVTTANPMSTPHEIANQLAAAGATVVFTESLAADKLPAHDGSLTVVLIDERRDGCLHFWDDLMAGVTDDNDEALTEDADRQFDPDDVVVLPYSSGTTGLPKGVMLTHRSLSTSVAQQVDGDNPNIGFTADDVILCALPMFHIYSLNTIMMCGLRVGAAIVVMRRFDLAKMMELVEKYRITIAPLVPPIVVAVAKSDDEATAAHDLSSVRMVLSGAAPMGKDIEDAFMAKLPGAVLGQGYGMTEAGPVLSMCLAFAKEPFKVKSGACGTVVRNAELKIVDPDTGKSLGRNLPGEICIRGQQIMKGYLNDPEATKNTIDADGWLHTGDVGYVDDDDEIFIVDRLKEIIKYKGFQVAPAELEALLITHPSISDAAVVGKQIEPEIGEIPVAFVAKTEGSDLSEDDIKQFVSKEVIYYKRIHKVFFVDKIPKAPSGKILRKELRKQLQQQQQEQA